MRSQLCPVRDDFRIIVVVEMQDAYTRLDLPLLNRFEKQVLSPAARDIVRARRVSPRSKIGDPCFRIPSHCPPPLARPLSSSQVFSEICSCSILAVAVHPHFGSFAPCALPLPSPAGHAASGGDAPSARRPSARRCAQLLGEVMEWVDAVLAETGLSAYQQVSSHPTHRWVGIWIGAAGMGSDGVVLILF